MSLVVVALTGLVVVQTVLLRSAFLSKEAAFKRNVMAAMGAVVQKVTAAEMVGYALQPDSGDSVAAKATVARFVESSLTMPEFS